MAIETLGAALRQIERLFAEGVISSLSDRRLLDLFIEERDHDAFEILVARHGPMVLSVCRGILRNPADIEDAFQATFLVLVKKAATIRGRQALGGWLYQVAHRVAVEANKAAARRRACEKEAGLMASATTVAGPALIDQLLSALHEEIARLPEKLRLAIVLCDLEGMTHAQAADELNWSERTLRRRLAEARERLKARLGRRDLLPDGAMLGAVFLREAQALVPPAWQAATVRAALDILDRAVAVGSVSLAAQSLTREVLKTMFVQKLTIAVAVFIGAGLMAWAASAALVSRGEKPKTAPAAVAQQAAPAPRPDVDADPFEAVGTFPVRGRVLDPDGQPVANAEVFIRHRTDPHWAPGDPPREGQQGRVAASDADGRFHFDLDKSASDWPFGDEPAWHDAQIAAVAPGLALAWVEAGALFKGDGAALRLVRDDVPIRGRVVDPQGRPIAGATVRVVRIGAVKDGADLDAMLASGELDDQQIRAWYGAYYDATWPGESHAWTTDADGRVEVTGIGRDRIGGLEISGPMLATSTLYVTARPAGSQPKPRPHPTPRDRQMPRAVGGPPRHPLSGATFEHIAGPTKPITGVVRLKGTGRPLARVRVNGTERATGTSLLARTDFQGRFRLVGLPKSELYQIRALPRAGIDPFLIAEITVTDTEGLKPIETTLELPRGVIVTGRLLDTTTGRPVRTDGVFYTNLPTNPNEGSGARGHSSLTDPTFRITVPPGGGMIYARARGKNLPYTRARLRKADKGKGGDGDGETYGILLEAYHAYKIIDVPADAESFHVDLELTRALTRKGRVVGPDGQPVAGAQCYGLGATWGEMAMLADDRFEVRGLEPGHPRQLIFAHKGRRLVGSMILKGEDSQGDEPLVVRLDRPGSIKGRLLDEDGQPLTGATLGSLTFDLHGTNLPPGPGRDAMWPDSDTVTTAADGRFQIVGLKPGIKTNHGITFKDRPGVWGDAGKVLREVVIQQPGEVRNLGDIKVKIVANQ